MANFFFVWSADGQIENGGIAQFFFNGLGRHAEQCVQALRDIGAHKKAECLHKAMGSFWGSRYPRTVEEYEVISDTAPEDDELYPEELDDLYYDSPEDVAALALGYLCENIEELKC